MEIRKSAINIRCNDMAREKANVARNEKQALSRKIILKFCTPCTFKSQLIS